MILTRLIVCLKMHTHHIPTVSECIHADIFQSVTAIWLYVIGLTYIKIILK